MHPNWDERYSREEFAYGEEPNGFFKEQLQSLPAGKILLPADGEGRNGVYAAQRGWQVSCADLSTEGKKKALALAAARQVTISYEVGDLDEMEFEVASFDVIALIYAHFPAAIKSKLQQKLTNYLKPGGLVIFEAFSKSHLPLRKADPKVGGPMDIDMLFSLDELKIDFQGLEIILLEEAEVTLNEGAFHNGESSVIRFVGRKV